MENEYQILKHIEKNQETSQRQIASRTGLSVGTVNLLLKKMVRKGLVKIEKLNAKTLRYIITPQGIAEKTRLVYMYLKVSYQRILRIHQTLEQIVEKYQCTKIVFLGEQDEILEMLKISAKNIGIEYEILSVKELSTYKKLKNNSKDLFITWTTDFDSQMMEEMDVINILELI